MIRFSLPLASTALLLVAEKAQAANESFVATSAALRLIWGLLLVLGILLIIYALLKKKLPFLQGGGGKGIITVIEMRHLMPRKSLCLVRVRGQEFLLGLGQDRISLIAAIPPAPDSELQGKQDFASILQSTGNTNNA